MLASLILTTVNMVVSGLLAIDDDGSFYNAVIRRGARRMGGARETDEPGVFMLEIDGLSEQSLRRGIEGGHAPTIARWLDEGSHRLLPWECDLSCQTSASQAGILLGDNTDIPAFRWYDKREGRIVVSSSGADCAALETRLSDGERAAGATTGSAWATCCPATRRGRCTRSARCRCATSRRRTCWACSPTPTGWRGSSR